MTKWDIPAKQVESVSSMVKEFADTMGQEPNPELSAILVDEEFDEWVEALCFEGAEAELKELSDLVYVIYGYANACGWDLDEAVRRVHQNNIGRCVQPDGSILRNEMGKILKNKDFPKVELGDLV